MSAPGESLRVAVDATPLLGQPTGVGAFVKSLLTAERNPETVSAFALSAKGANALPSLLPDNIRVVGKPMPASLLMRRWKHHDSPKAELFGIKADLVHGTNFVVPPTKAASMITVHDLTCVRFPELCTPETLRFPALIQRAINKGALVHTPTEAVADEVREYFDVEAKCVRTIHHGLDPAPFATRALTDVTRGHPFVLAVGTVEPRKDYPTLVRAFEKLASRDRKITLVIAGSLAWGASDLTELVANSRHRERIKLLGYVDNATRLSLLQAARVLAFPSRYEGFGVPPLEAMRAGVPVVATEVPAVQEVCGDAPLWVPVGDDDALAQALEATVKDDAVRAQCISRGHAQSQRYSWSVNHRRMRALYAYAVAMK